MDKDTSEIAKLTERISKDPKSKLFVPLAEEYKKAGDIEMSVFVLSEGLKNNPGYVTARSFLGRLLIEKGDLAGARKEFEEVIKAIPDNLMAHRKLGDIHALEARTSVALQHYKTVLSLNPKDSETAMLIAEAESGRDITRHIAGPKTAGAGEPRKVREQKPGPPHVAVKIPQQQVPSRAAQPKPVRPASVAADEEEAEEVLIVEPLEPLEFSGSSSRLDRDLAEKNLDFLAEQVQEQDLTEVGTDSVQDAFALNDPFNVGEPLQEPVFEAQEPLEQEKQADDFTTDTLAELYISQGFFEKAVDIYERMLIDKPNSQGLKDKLAKVRAMAASSAPVEEAPAEAIVFDSMSGFGEDLAPSSDPDSFLSAAPPVPAADPKLSGTDDWAPAETNAFPVDDDVHRDRQPVSPEQHFDAGFEPREYVPPDALPRQGSEQSGLDDELERKPPEPRKAPAGRQETVERLESWLKNIMKEK